MVQEAEEFAAEDEANRKRIEALNSLSSFVYSLKSQLNDKEGLGGKLDEDDKDAVLDLLKETTQWIDNEGPTATAEDLEERLQELQNSVNPYTSKIYGESGGYGGEYAPGDDDDQEPFRSHDEL